MTARWDVGYRKVRWSQALDVLHSGSQRHRSHQLGLGMALLAPRICPHCQRVVAAGLRCPCAPRTRSPERRPSARARGYDTKWDKESREHLRLHPHCTMCGKPASVVDHRIPHKGDMKLFWQRSNWQSLCTHDHNSTKQRIERKTGGEGRIRADLPGTGVGGARELFLTEKSPRRAP
jgi:5-methylcytosine-specific restriction protein A